MPDDDIIDIIDLQPLQPMPERRSRRRTGQLYPAEYNAVPVPNYRPAYRKALADTCSCCRQKYCRYCGRCHTAYGYCGNSTVVCAEAQADLMHRDNIPPDEPPAEQQQEKRSFWKRIF